MKPVLLIAYHFPPCQVSSGLQRTIANVAYLPNHGWRPLVLSANPMAYPTTSEGQVKDIPAETVVTRAFALDTARHLRIGRAYPGFLALPDRWVSWWLGAVPAGLGLIRRHKPRAIWSTYPIATAHLIALSLHKLTGLPWIADFRDSMTEPDYPTNRRQRKIFQWIERKTVTNCTRAVFTTESAVKMYRQRYPEISDDKWVIIPNGYNEAIFAEVESEPANRAQTPAHDARLTLVHSGVIYPSERDPVPFFNAIEKLVNSGAVDPKQLRIVLRASGHEHLFRPMLVSRKIDQIVELAPPLSYREALKETLEADGLLVLQASSCNHQIPAKIYEYFRAGRPILALTDADGDTAASLRDAGISTIVSLDDSDAIASALEQFIDEVKSGTAASASKEAIQRCSRAFGAQTLAELLDRSTA